MKPNGSKNRKLIAQYPFLNTILNVPLAPFSDAIYHKLDDLAIRVERADGTLMYRRANNVGLGDGTAVFSMKPARRDQIMRRREYLFAINGHGKIINRLDWSPDEWAQKSKGEKYAWEILWGRKEADGNLSNNISAHIAYLVWATVDAWYDDTHASGINNRFGAFRDRSMTLTVYGAPREGFDRLEKDANVWEHLTVDGGLMTRGMLDKNQDIIMMSGMLYEMCIQFQDEVYFNGMKKVLDAGRKRGASGQFGPVKVLCAEMCGYDRVMLEGNGCFVTFQLRPDSRQMYVLGQQGTLPQIRNIVRTVISRWNGSPEQRAAFAADGDVHVV